jgi:hypothetical protein
MQTLISETLSLEARITVIKNWDLSDVEARIKKHVSPDFDIDTAIAEYRNWVVLLSYVTDRWLYVPNAELDEVWHNHMLYTRDYFKMCEALIGKGAYIHHQPENVCNKMSDEEMAIMSDYSHRYLGDVPFRVSPYLTSCGGYCWTC